MTEVARATGGSWKNLKLGVTMTAPEVHMVHIWTLIGSPLSTRRLHPSLILQVALKPGWGLTFHPKKGNMVLSYLLWTFPKKP